MFCKNCGEKFKDDAAFCEKCGTAVKKPVAQTANVKDNATESKATVTENVSNKAPDVKEVNNVPNAVGGTKDSGSKKNRNKILGIGVIAAVVLILVLVIFKKPTIDMNKYIEVEFDGYDGVGSVHVTIDWKQMEKDYGDKLKIGKLSKEEKSAIGLLGVDQDEIAFMYLQDCIDYSVSQNTGLSNGDTVNLEWDIDTEGIEEYLNVKIKATDKEYKVTNLEEVDLFDPFEYITLEYTGTAPNGYAEVKKDNNEEMMNYFNVSVSNNSNLSNGDKITVTMSINMTESNFANKFGCLPSEQEKEYEVSGLPGYITATSEIPEETMAKMKKQSEDIILGSTADWNKESKLAGVEYIGNYFITPKGTNYGCYNKIYLVYKVNATITREMQDTTTSQDVTYYYGVAFSNLMTVPQDGSVFVDLTQYEKIQNSFRKELEFIGPSGAVSGRYYFNGYETLDEIYNIVVIKNIENYNYEENITK